MRIWNGAIQKVLLKSHIILKVRNNANPPPKIGKNHIAFQNLNYVWSSGTHRRIKWGRSVLRSFRSSELCHRVVLWLNADVSEQHTAYIYNHEDGGSMLLRNAGIRLQDCTVTQFRRAQSEVNFCFGPLSVSKCHSVPAEDYLEPFRRIPGQHLYYMFPCPEICKSSQTLPGLRWEFQYRHTYQELTRGFRRKKNLNLFFLISKR
jgi:hypothetical protein